MQTSPQDALPALTLTSLLNARTKQWTPLRDLLNSEPGDTEFVVEVEGDGTASLRFGDNTHGLRPDSGTSFTASYRVGNGAAGNVGADSIMHIVSGDGGIDAVRNPLAAGGGVEPEAIEDVRQRAPYAYRTQERAVTPDDYARVTERNTDVQRAAAAFRWTGSWRTVFVTVDRLGGLPVDAPFQETIVRYLDRYRMAGHDVDVDAPRVVSLEIEMLVCVKPDYFRSDVKQALLEVFSNRILPDGRRGVFHPDNFTFGQPVYLSKLYADAQSVAGVDSVQITKFQRQGNDASDATASGVLDIGRLEIARCDNDPNYPEHGVFRLTLKGGK
jgi:predicted phage baseplate assembly protein